LAENKRTAEAILAKLVAFQTVSRAPNMALIEFVASFLREIEATVTLVPGPAGRANLFATVGPDDVPGVVLSGHSDVVPVEGQDWSSPPFELSQRSGRLFGRGTADMKGFVACALVAMANASKWKLRAPLHIALSYDEEIGCVGVHSLLEQLAMAPVQPRFCIIGEPTSMRVAIGHKGKRAFSAEFHGREIHSALAPGGLNAVQMGAEFCLGIQQLQTRLAAEGPRDDAYEVPYSTMHVGKFSGGVALNIVPNHARIEYELRSVPAEDSDAICEQIQELAERIVAVRKTEFPEADVTIKMLTSYPGLETGADDRVVEFVKSLTGANGTTKVAFGTEGGLFSEHLQLPVVICGPGSMDQGHKPDEFVAIDQLRQCDQMLENLVTALARGL
jgi:acetylornithine deacetylase